MSWAGGAGPSPRALGGDAALSVGQNSASGVLPERHPRAVVSPGLFRYAARRVVAFDNPQPGRNIARDAHPGPGGCPATMLAELDAWRREQAAATGRLVALALERVPGRKVLKPKAVP